MFSVDLLNRIRVWELERIASHFREGANVLEIGAGTGQQALCLSNRGFAVEAVEAADSEYSGDLVYPVKLYDGRTLPYPEGTFDYVFSSNVLEHVADLPRMHAEILRVLKPEGRVIHVVPTHIWRFWTILSTFVGCFQYIRALKDGLLPRHPITLRQSLRAWREVGYRIRWALVQHRHGVSGNAISEIWTFRPGRWRRNFLANGFVVEHESPIGIFYTGNTTLGRLGIAARVRLSKYLGSACQLFVIAPASHAFRLSSDTRARVHAENLH